MSSIMQSSMVKFIIDKDRRRFSIHMALASSFPKDILQLPLNSEIDEVVFGYCCEFVYTGDYTVSLPNSNPSGSAVVQHSNDNTVSQKFGTRWNPMNLTENLFHPTNLSDIHAPVAERLGPVPWYEDGDTLNADPADNYTNVFPSHVQVYRLGYRTNWNSLCHRSLYWLLRSLARFKLFQERTEDIVKFLRFVFEESECMENLQKILRDYAAWNVEILMRDTDFQQLLDRVPTLEKAIFSSMWK
ncbi:uncharacterized protein KD926_003481 [Aspergillus affinis]|uniref:uncharacterized protein n=1 Tax=Aspergillus affinis TaxID=1070780 RepID=UPI0022FDF8AB|nr:uncharacterized protein KD926_003481 [Aspergillus affinis]KAI9035455.1 hypothetical protein KD926_003481 [Aspergillus affinis]